MNCPKTSSSTWMIPSEVYRHRSSQTVTRPSDIPSETGTAVRWGRMSFKGGLIETKERNTMWWTFREEERNHSTLRFTHIWSACLLHSFEEASPMCVGMRAECQLVTSAVRCVVFESLHFTRNKPSSDGAAWEPWEKKKTSAENVSKSHPRLVMSLARSENGTSRFQHVTEDNIRNITKRQTDRQIHTRTSKWVNPFNNTSLSEWNKSSDLNSPRAIS